MKLFRSIKFKLTVWYVIVLAVILIVFSGLSYFFVARDAYNNAYSALRARAAEISSSIFYQGPQGSLGIAIQTELGEMVQLYNTQGSMIFSSGQQLETETVRTLFQNALYGDNKVVPATTISGQRVILYSLQLGNQQLSPVLIVGHSINEAQQTLNEFRRILLTGVICAIILAGVGGFFLATRALKPVNEITRTTRKIKESDLSQRINVKSNDELGHLAETINEMIARLEKSFERQRQFTADASHELRTPLSVIEAEASLALRRERSPEDYQKSLESVNEEVSYMSSILEKLLVLARADAGTEQISFNEINLKDLVENISSDIEILAGEKGIKFTASYPTDAMILGDQMKLKQLLLNLLDNALKYTHEGTISLSLETQGKEAVIKVSDTGIGIPEECQTRIFERFYRVDKARSRSEHGTGLGLAIAKYIVEAHSGRIEVTSEEGKGSTFTVYLPLISGTARS